jgi:predicted kinase
VRGPILFYTVGYPGAGKTTFASALTTWLKAEHIRGDKIGLELFRFPTFSPQEKAMVYQEMTRRAVDALGEGRHVLYDASVNTQMQRAQLEALAVKSQVPAIGLWLQTPVELAKKRAGKARDSGVGQPVARVIPPHIFDHIIAGFEAPTRDEAVLSIPGDRPFFMQYRGLRARLGRAGIARLPRIVSF